MGVFESKSEFAKNLEGVHLFHFTLSNCSQRCRFALELKEVDWKSHHLDISKGEHLTEAYLEINPNGVVPTLVHNGLVVLESNDIITYIDENFPGVGFTPADSADSLVVADFMRSSGDVQAAIKVLSHEYLFAARRQQINSAQIREMEQGGASSDLILFLRDFVTNGSEWKTRLDKSHHEVNNRVQELEGRLSATEGWLSGSAFGLADMSWSVNYYRLAQCGLTFTGAPLYEAWGSRVKEIPAFQKAVVNYRPEHQRLPSVPTLNCPD